MRFSYTNDRLPKVTTACSKDKTRPQLTVPYFDAELAEIQATDSVIAVRVPVGVEGKEASGFLPLELITEGRKLKASAIKAPAKKDGPKLGTFPNLAGLWPTAKELKAPAFRIALNAGLLHQLADALGSDNGVVELVFPQYGKDGPHAQKPIVVRPLLKSATPIGADMTARTDSPEGAVSLPEGLLCPVRLPQTTAEPVKRGAAKQAAKAASNGTSSRSEAALKAAATRRANQAKQPGGVASAMQKVAGKKVAATRKPAHVAGAARGKRPGAKPPVATDRGKGSEARKNAALKAAATRRANLAAAAA